MKRSNTVAKATNRLQEHLLQALTKARQQPDRGDVPGWVLITVMTAGLVAALWLIAEPLLANLFSSAVSGVTGP